MDVNVTWSVEVAESRAGVVLHVAKKAYGKTPREALENLRRLLDEDGARAAEFHAAIDRAPADGLG